MPQRRSVDSTQGCLLRALRRDLWDDRQQTTCQWSLRSNASLTRYRCQWRTCQADEKWIRFQYCVQSNIPNPQQRPYASWRTQIHQPICIVTTMLLVTRSEKLRKDVLRAKDAFLTLVAHIWWQGGGKIVIGDFHRLGWPEDNTVLTALLHLPTHTRATNAQLQLRFHQPLVSIFQLTVKKTPSPLR